MLARMVPRMDDEGEVGLYQSLDDPVRRSVAQRDVDDYDVWLADGKPLVGFRTRHDCSHDEPGTL